MVAGQPGSKLVAKRVSMKKWFLIPWLGLLVITLMTTCTPLTFCSLQVRNCCWLVTTGGTFLVVSALARHFFGKPIHLLLGWAPIGLSIAFGFLICVAFPWSLFNLANNILGHWETVSITHRLRNNPSTFIALQMTDVGALGYNRRTVVINPVTALFYWPSTVPSPIASKEWHAVEEDFNPFEWKGL